MHFETASGAGGAARRVVVEPPDVGYGRGVAGHEEDVYECEGCDAESFEEVCEQVVLRC